MANNGVSLRSRKRATLVGVGGEPNSQDALRSHHDVSLVKDILTCTYQYAEEDIVVMIDTPDIAPHLRPTKHNIISQARRLVEDAQPGDCLVFFFAGHGRQKRCHNKSEADGQDEYIDTADHKQIKDDTLRQIMVDQLPPRTQLVALFDSCHGGTMLDLPYLVPHAWSLELTAFIVARAKHLVMRVRARKGAAKGSAVLSAAATLIMERARAQGRHYNPCLPPKWRAEERGRVISLSSTADSQISLESSKGGPLAHALAEIIETTPKPTFGQLLGALQRHFVRERTERLAQIAQLEKFEQELSKLAPEYDKLPPEVKELYDERCLHVAMYKDAIRGVDPSASQRPQLWSNSLVRLDDIFSLDVPQETLLAV